MNSALPTRLGGPEHAHYVLYRTTVGGLRGICGRGVGDQEVARGEEYYQCSLYISEVARLDCAERKLSYLRPRNSDL